MAKARQRDFFEKHREFAPRRHTHGGDGAKGLRKLKRPLDRKRPVHLVLHAAIAKHKMSMLGPKNQLVIDKIIKERAKQFGITLHSKQNVGNHLHIVASFPQALEFQNFLRTITALIARHVTGARRGKPFGKRFWDHLAFTRVIYGRRDFKGLGKYVQKNRIQAEFGPLARQAVEEYEAARRKALKLGVDICKILESSAG
jgi:hypothetical protein